VARSNYDKLFRQANDLEQKRLSNYVEIHGIPEFDKNSIPIVEKIASVLEVELSVVQAFKTLSKSKNRPVRIIAELTTREQKDTLVLSTKTKNLTTKQLNADWQDKRVFINGSLTAYNSKLLFKTRAFARDKGFRYVWFCDYKLYLKKAEYSRVYLIRHENDLNNVV